MCVYVVKCVRGLINFEIGNYYEFSVCYRSKIKDLYFLVIGGLC
jgi:hypothetical protein